MSFEKIFIKDLSSTQTYLTALVKSQKIQEKIAIYTNRQTHGIGSRGNTWQSDEGNLYVSFCIHMSDLPKDLQIGSSSVYFAYLAKLVFAKLGKSAWVKWPNDLYDGEKKLGGLITTKVGKMLICGMGVNFLSPPDGACGYDDVDKEMFLDEYLKIVEAKISWKSVFDEYVLDFEKTRKFYFNLGDKRVSLENAFLYQDGSILLENQRIYSLR